MSGQEEERRRAVSKILENLHDTKIKGLKDLFCSELNYNHENKPLSPRQWPDSARRGERVRPLLAILNHYRFTLTENTPFDQEVALDPELLGHVFENLLAAYNPETEIVVRKATGSFYAPRVVVDWMVDQALSVYLGGVLSDGGPRSVVAAPGRRGRDDRIDPSGPVPGAPRMVAEGAGSDATERVPPGDHAINLKCLLSWEDAGPEFSPKETEILIDAIDRMKALDPAWMFGLKPKGGEGIPSPFQGEGAKTPIELMKAYFEQWLNGLVYELFFPGELHARKLTLFDETAKLNPPDLSRLPENQKLPRLKELFETAYDSNAPLCAMLFDLPSLEVVRIIEDVQNGGKNGKMDEEET